MAKSEIFESSIQKKDGKCFIPCLRHNIFFFGHSVNSRLPLCFQPNKTFLLCYILVPYLQQFVQKTHRENVKYNIVCICGNTLCIST